MGLFDSFKRKTKTALTPEQTIKYLIDDLPQYYTTHRQYKNCIEYLEHGEWGLAQDSLIELAKETGHFFSDDFWFGLADAADKMQLTKKVDYCRKQARITKNKINWTISKGSTVNKINDNHYNQYYSQKVHDRWDNNRRTKDKLQSFINKDGFHIQKGGRDGTIYYISNGKVCEIYWEMSGVPQYNILIGFDLVDSWALPTKQLFSDYEKQKIETELLLWLKEQNIKADINPKRIDPSTL